MARWRVDLIRKHAEHLGTVTAKTEKEAIAPSYGSRLSRAVGEQFLGWLNVTKGQRWLDVGCGNGAFTELLIARMSPTEVMAIDPSDAR